MHGSSDKEWFDDFWGRSLWRGREGKDTDGCGRGGTRGGRISCGGFRVGGLGNVGEGQERKANSKPALTLWLRGLAECGARLGELQCEVVWCGAVVRCYASCELRWNL